MIQPNPFYAPMAALDPKLQGVAIVLACVALFWLLLRLVGRLPIARSGYQRGFMRSASASPLFPARPYLPQSSFSVIVPFAQMKAIAAVEFEVQPLLNREEARLLPMLEDIIRSHGSGHRVMAQTSMGEVIRPKSTSASPTVRKAAYASINSKRLDFIVIDRFGHMVAAIEYQGTGHHQNNAFLRDAVKREAVRKAGVPYLEILPGFTAQDLLHQLSGILKQRSISGSDGTVVDLRRHTDPAGS